METVGVFLHPAQWFAVLGMIRHIIADFVPDGEQQEFLVIVEEIQKSLNEAGV